MKKYLIGILCLTSIGCGSVPSEPQEPDYVNKLSSGIWGSQCSLRSNGNRVKETFSLKSNLDVTRSTTYYSDQDCLIPEYTVNESGTASLSYPKWGLVFINVTIPSKSNVYRFYELEGEEHNDLVSCSEGEQLTEANLETYDLIPEDLQHLGCENDLLTVERQYSMDQVSYIGGDGKEGRLLNYTFNKVEVLVQSESAAVSLRQSSLECGLSGVDVGDLVTISGNCAIPDKLIYASPEGKLGFDVVKISGETVFFGDDSLAGEALFSKNYAPFGPRTGGRRGKYESQVENDRALAFDTNRVFRKL